MASSAIQFSPGAGSASGGAPGLSMHPDQTKGPQESELQRLLSEENIRSEQHKLNYQTMKAEHTRLQQDYGKLETEISGQREESRLTEDKFRQLINHLQNELTSRAEEQEELRKYAVTPQRLEMIHLKVQEELDAPYRERFAKMDADIEKYRQDFNKIRYDYSFLKAEYDHDKHEHARILEETQLKYEAEISNLKRDKEALLTRYNTESDKDAQKIRTLQRENVSLNQKVKGLLSELEEIRAQRESSGLQSDHVTRLQNKQILENNANIKILQTEKESLRHQADHVAKELMTSLDTHQGLSDKINELETENRRLKSELEETHHTSKTAVNNMRMESVRARGELERERSSLKAQIDDMETKIEVLEMNAEKQSTSLSAKDKEMVRKLQAIKEEEWAKQMTLHNENVELQAKVEDMERQRNDEDSTRANEKAKFDKRVKCSEDKARNLDNELQSVKIKLDHKSSIQQQLESEQLEHSDSKQKLLLAETELQQMIALELEMTQTNDKLKNTVDTLREHLQLLKRDLDKASDMQQTHLDQQKSAWSDEKVHLAGRVGELEEQLSKFHRKLKKAAVLHKTKKHKYHKWIVKMRDKMELLKAKQEQLEAERDALKRTLPVDIHASSRRALKELQRRHVQFRDLLLHSSNDIPAVDKSFSIMSQGGTSTPYYSGVQELEKEHKRELDLLKGRLDRLDETQRLQLLDYGKKQSSNLDDSDKDQNDRDCTKDDIIMGGGR